MHFCIRIVRERILSLNYENHVTYNFRDSSLFLMGRMCLKTKSITEKLIRGVSDLSKHQREREKGGMGWGRECSTLSFYYLDLWISNL